MSSTPQWQPARDGGNCERVGHISWVALYARERVGAVILMLEGNRGAGITLQ